MADDKPFDPTAYLKKATGTAPSAVATPGSGRAPVVPPLEPPPAEAVRPSVAAAPVPEDQAYTDLGVPIGSGTGAGAGGNPYGTFATAGRVITGGATGIPDVLTAIGNAAVRASGPGGSFGMAGVPTGEVAKEAPYPGQLLNQRVGVPELPPDASLARRLLEGGGSALVGGGVNSIIRNVAAANPALTSQLWQAAKTLTTNVAAPTLAAEGGGAAGESIAKYLKLDPQTGALLGSLLGGSIAGAAPGAYDRYSHGWYADRAKPNAPEIAAAAERMGGTATPGMLGNNTVQGIERQIGSSIGGKDYIEQRRAGIHDVMGQALERAAEARGEGGTSAAVTPGTIGERLATAARESAEGMRTRSDEAQARLMDRVGAQTPVLLRGLQETGREMQLPGTGIEPGMKANIAHRLGPAIEAMLIRRDNDIHNQPTMFGPDGQPIQRPVDPYAPPPGAAPLPTPFNRGARQPAPIPPMTASEAFERYRGAQPPPPAPAPAPPPVRGMGDNGGPPLPVQESVAAPYADVRAYRTELGRDLDLPGGQRLGPAAQLYGPTTDAMRATAERQNVPRQDFENTMARTQAVETTPAHIGDPTGDYRSLMDVAVKKPDEAYAYLNRAEQNAPDMAMLEAMQHPSFGGIMGDLIRQIGREGINNPNEGAAGPRQTATRLEGINPESKSIIYGDQAPAMRDVETTTRAYNYPTSQTGINRAMGGATDRNMVGVMLSNVLDNMGGPVGAALTMGAMPLLTRLRAGALNSPQTLNALRGGAAPAPANISDLAAAMSAAAAANDRLQVPRR
jgi:hypothetical protein